MADPDRPAAGRPSVAVIVPFAGSDEQLERVLGTLGTITLGSDDEVIVADNRTDARSFHVAGRIQVRAAGARHTPAFARNQGAETAQGEWLVFIDADTVPGPSLIDAYFDPPPGASTGVLAGGIVDSAVHEAGLAARYALAHAHMSQATTLRREWPYAQTANCAVRRSAFVEVGGFRPEARAGEDADLCFRLREAGWGLEERAQAVVEHRGRETVASLLAQLARHGSGVAWAERRFPGSFPAPSPTQLARRLAHSAREAGRELRAGDRDAAELAALDALTALAFELGRLLPNERPLRLPRRRRG